MAKNRCGLLARDSWGTVPRQQGFEVFYRSSLRQALKYVAQPRIGLLAVGFGSFDQAIDLRTGSGALGRVAEHPIFATYHKGLYRSFCPVVIDGQEAGLDVTLKLAPVAGQITDGLAQGTLRRHLGMGFLQPAFQFCEYRQAFFLSSAKALVIAGFFVSDS